MGQVFAAAGDQIAVSDLSRLECRMKPIRLGDSKTLAVYDGFFSRPDVCLLSINTAVFDRATNIRAIHKFAVQDSIHLAAAVEGGCGRFLTNDTRLNRFSDIPVEILP